MASGYHEVWVLTYHTPTDDDLLGVYETQRLALARGDDYIADERAHLGVTFEPEWTRTAADTPTYTRASVGDADPGTYVVRQSMFERVV